MTQLEEWRKDEFPDPEPYWEEFRAAYREITHDWWRPDPGLLALVAVMATIAVLFVAFVFIGGWIAGVVS